MDQTEEAEVIAQAVSTQVQQSYLSNDALMVLVTLLAAGITAFFAWQRHRQERIFALERNLDIQQRLNEIALSSEENLKAAFTSVRDDGVYDQEKAREVFFHFMRLNRMYRAWVLWKNRVLKKEDYELIVGNYARTLVKAEPLLNDLRYRGYDENFVRDLKVFMAGKDAPPLIPLDGTIAVGAATEPPKAGAPKP